MGVARGVPAVRTGADHGARVAGDLYTRQQQVAQSILIWLVPLAGAIVVYAGLRQHDDVSEQEPNEDVSEHESLWGNDEPPSRSGDT